MKIETQISAKEYLGITMRMYFKRPIFMFFGCIGVILLLCYFTGWNIEGKSSTPNYYFLLALFLLVINPFLFYQTMKKQISKNLKLTEKITYEFTEQQIKIIGETFNAEVSWGEIKKITENKNWFIIYQTQRILNFIPKSSFTIHLEEFKQLIKDIPLK